MSANNCYIIRNYDDMKSVYPQFWGDGITKLSYKEFQEECWNDRIERCPDKFPCVVTIGEGLGSEPGDVYYEVKNIEYYEDILKKLRFEQSPADADELMRFANALKAFEPKESEKSKKKVKSRYQSLEIK